MACLGLQAAQVDTLLVRSESMNKDIKVVAIRPDSHEGRKMSGHLPPSWT